MMNKTMLCAIALLMGGLALFVGCGPQEQTYDVNRAASQAPQQERPVEADASATQGQPKLVVEPEDVDMGTIPNDKPTTIEFTVTNGGDASLTEIKVKASCGCTGATIDRDSLEPGESTTARVTLDPAKVHSFQTRKTATFFSNDKQTGSKRVVFTANIEPEFHVIPDSIDFGTVKKGESVEKTILFRQAGDEPVELKGVRPMRNLGVFETEFEQRPASEWENPERPEYDITLRIKPSAPTGPIREHLNIMTTCSRVRNYRLAPKGSIDSFYTMRPNQIVTIRDIMPGQTRRSVVSLVGEKPFDVTNLQISNTSLTASYRAVENENRGFIDVTMAEDAASGSVAGELSFTISADGESVRESLRLSGYLGERQANRVVTPPHSAERRRAAKSAARRRGEE